MKKITGLLFMGFVLTGYCFSQTVDNVNITVEVINVVVNGGTVYLDVFPSAESYKKTEPFVSLALTANNAIVFQKLSLPTGEYLLSVYQDANNNQKLDYGLFGIPKELVGLSNYFGKGYPSKSFDKHKITVDNLTEKITLGLYKF